MERDKKELLFAVNPVFATAKGCLGLLQHTGIKEAAALAETIDTTVQRASNTPPDILKTYMVSNEARYHIGNIMAERSGCDIIVDLPCGYVPRGLVVSEKGKTFYGLDLPAVIEELEPAIRGIASDEQNKRMHFCAVDATNYASLKEALKDADGKICILTDGLLGYFNNSELEVVCSNIHRLLAEYGGVWITGDKNSREIASATFSVLTNEDGEIVKQLMEKGGAKVADIPVSHTVIQGPVKEAKQYFHDHGFDVKEIPYGEMVPDLLGLKENPEQMEALRLAYQEVFLWQMTVRSEKSKEAEKGNSFSVQFHTAKKELHCSIIGRLDTITAPELLSGFQSHHTNDIQQIVVDMTDTEYVSSAGLRVLLIMCKALPDKEKFFLKNPSEEIMEILHLTGFADIFNTSQEP